MSSVCQVALSIDGDTESALKDLVVSARSRPHIPRREPVSDSVDDENRFIVNDFYRVLGTELIQINGEVNRFAVPKRNA